MVICTTYGSHLLQLNYETYSSLILSLEKRLARQEHIAVSNTDVSNIGHTYYNPNTFYARAVGINLINSGDASSMNSDTVSDYTFLEHVQGLYHEIRHVRQSHVLWNKHDALGIDLACSHISLINNENFYFDHYSELACETDADRYAVPKTYDFLQNLSSQFGITKQQADELMTAYVNDRCMDPGYFLKCYHPDAYLNMKDVKNNLDRCYDMSQKFKQREVPLKYRLKCRYGQSFDVMKEFLSVYPEYCEPMQIAFQMRDETEMMAGIMLSLYPEWKQNFRALNNEDMSIQALFGMSLTEAQWVDMRSQLDKTEGLIELRQKRIKQSERATYTPPADTQEQSMDEGNDEYD